MMLSTSVLCMKKKKKKTYSLAGGKTNVKNVASRPNTGVAVNMLHITEDTPPDMLAGAMDLTVHLPTGKNVKMAVERSTPMMDLLVQITTAHQLQLSNYTLQALGMAPSSDHRDKILPYKPNTPIGTLDTQHIKVVPKIRNIAVPKNVPPGHQPFESTFRLKVYLPRNQLFVTRVSRNVMLEDIMKKICEEKKLDPVKYEFKHPGNLDETLDPKLTISDYQITEIYLVAKGSLSQAFSSSDIMALRKEEERKQMHNKTGGGVFNLIFRRGKSSMGSGSVSSDTRSISPTHSDDSRSVTPPGVIQQPILPPPKQDPERPKPPQRKRRPAPKPPQQPTLVEDTRYNADNILNDANSSRTSTEITPRLSEEKPPSNISNTSEASEMQANKNGGGLVISHSRTSSDSSGYHEASVLSENCNTSLPRRPKSAFVGSGDMEKLSKMHSQSSSNLSKMASHSKSTNSLGITGRKKKSAPPPPPTIRASNPQINVEPTSPVVASQTTSKIATPSTPLENLVAQSAPKPLPRSKSKAPPAPIPHPRSEIITSSRIDTVEETSEEKSSPISKIVTNSRNNTIDNQTKPHNSEILTILSNESMDELIEEKIPTKVHNFEKVDNNVIVEDIIKKVVIDEITNRIQTLSEETPTTSSLAKDVNNNDNNNIKQESQKINVATEEKSKLTYSKILELQRKSHKLIFSSAEFKTKIEEAKIKLESPTEEEVNQLELPREETNSIHIEENTTQPKVTEAELPKEIHSKRNKIATCIESDITMGKPADNHNEDNIKEEKSNQLSPNASVNKKLPEVVGVIPKTSKDKKPNNKFDSFGRRRLQTSPLSESFEEDSTSTKSDSVSTRNSVCSALNTFNFIDELSDLDDKVFSGSISSKKNFSFKEEVFNELYGIHSMDDVNLEKNQSISSLRSLRSLPGFLNTGSGMKKWSNFEDLDDISLASQGPNSRWVIGESEPESLASHQALDSLESSNHILSENKDESKPFGSTDSGIAQETNEKLLEPEEYRPVTPPPPPLFVDEPTLEHQLKEEEVRERLEKENNKEDNIVAPSCSSKENAPKSLKETGRLKEPIEDIARESPDLNYIDWEYQLPSPPKAFRDTSPVIYDESTSSETHSVTDLKDSVVTSPELFEKLKSVEERRSISTVDTQSVATFVADEPPLNTLSLENLEKRKSLVYNRELSTSLKASEEQRMDPYTNSLNKFETTFIEVQKSSQTEIRQPKYVQKTPASTSHTLPNFKISTYDRPKEKIKVFEDDTIRSNVNGIRNVKTTYADSSYPSNTFYSNLNRSYVTTSMENITVRKNSIENKSTEKEYTFFRPEHIPITKSYGPVTGVFRSESFSTDNTWSPTKPVSRSRSYLTVNGNNKYKTGREINEEEGMERSNSLYDVSGLQSLGVMRLIQNKLNTPTSSLENLNHNQEKYDKSKVITESQNEIPARGQPKEIIHKSTTTEKIYKYQGPPSINMGTWSDRPKIPVSVKEDEDYTQGNISSKLIVNTTTNNITSNNSIEIRNGGGLEAQEPSVSIKVNGTDVPTTTETTTTTTGNIVIKIGNPTTSQPKMIDNQRFISHTTATGYRRPLSDINKNQRPHSIALGSEIEISRVPVVRAVELKKPYKDFGNTSVTQICQSEPQPQNGYLEDKKYFPRFTGIKSAAPVVRGFRPISKDKEIFTPNFQVPFSQGTLRRTQSSKIFEENSPNLSEISTTELKPVQAAEKTSESYDKQTETNHPPPPPPPMMHKVNLKKPVVRHIEPVLDPRDELLSAIRNFGGKKGLRPAKV